MRKIKNLQKMMTSLDIFVKKKSASNWPENAFLNKYSVMRFGIREYVYICNLNLFEYRSKKPLYRIFIYTMYI